MKLIIPAPGFLLIELIENEKQNAIGIALSNISNLSMKAKVIAIGKPRDTEYGVLLTTHVLVGDIIYYKPHTQQEIPNYESSTKYAFIPFETVMGTIKEEAK